MRKIIFLALLATCTASNILLNLTVVLILKSVLRMNFQKLSEKWSTRYYTCRTWSFIHQGMYDMYPTRTAMDIIQHCGSHGSKVGILFKQLGSISLTLTVFVRIGNLWGILKLLTAKCSFSQHGLLYTLYKLRTRLLLHCDPLHTDT